MLLSLRCLRSLLASRGHLGSPWWGALRRGRPPWHRSGDPRGRQHAPLRPGISWCPAGDLVVPGHLHAGPAVGAQLPAKG